MTDEGISEDRARRAAANHLAYRRAQWNTYGAGRCYLGHFHCRCGGPVTDKLPIAPCYREEHAILVGYLAAHCPEVDPDEHLDGLARQLLFGGHDGLDPDSPFLADADPWLEDPGAYYQGVWERLVQLEALRQQGIDELESLEKAAFDTHKPYLPLYHAGQTERRNLCKYMGYYAERITRYLFRLAGIYFGEYDLTVYANPAFMNDLFVRYGNIGPSHNFRPESFSPAALWQELRTLYDEQFDPDAVYRHVAESVFALALQTKGAITYHKGLLTFVLPIDSDGNPDGAGAYPLGASYHEVRRLFAILEKFARSRECVEEAQAFALWFHAFENQNRLLTSRNSVSESGVEIGAYKSKIRVRLTPRLGREFRNLFASFGLLDDAVLKRYPGEFSAFRTIDMMQKAVKGLATLEVEVSNDSDALFKTIHTYMRQYPLIHLDLAHLPQAERDQIGPSLWPAKLGRLEDHPKAANKAIARHLAKILAR